MKIAILDMDNLKNPFWGAGQARATKEVGKILSKKHQVTIYCSKYPGYKDYIEDNVKYIHVGIVSKSSRLTNAVFILSLPLLVRTIKADVIVENFNAPISVSFAPLFTNIPVVGLPTMFNAKEFSKKYRLPFHWIEKFGMKFYKYLLPYSDVDCAKAIQLNPNIVYKIVPQGVGREYFQIEHKKPEYILFLGRFDIQQKGIDLLLQAYSSAKDRIKYPLILAGHGPDEAKIRGIIHKLELENKVQIFGPAYGEKKYRLISKAIYVVFPSRHDEISLWSLEALAAGLPLVAFDLPESNWLKPEVALKAKPFDVNEFSNLMIRAQGTRLNRKMRANSRIFAKNFSWRKVASKIEDFLEYVVQRG